MSALTQMPTTESVTSTVVGNSRLPPTIETKIDGLPSSPDSGYASEFQKFGMPQEAIIGGVLPTVIPPTHAKRTLVVCFDGTGDQFDNDNSNIVQLVALLKKDDRHQQHVYYQTGIGTDNVSHSSILMSGVRKTLDTMVAWSLRAHVIGGYEFLMQNYIAGDKICLFGFSRGAYTARSLAGMLHKIGLLPAGNFQQVPFAYKMYKRSDDVGWEQSNEFKKAFCVDVPIEFVGVWDTVDSVGIIPKRLPFTTSNTIVRTFRHAVALDERRAKFKANLWNRPDSKECHLGTTASTGGPTKPGHTDEDQAEGSKKKKAFSKEDPGDKHLNALERLYSETTTHKTDIQEVWFAGCHCDVGGGSVSNKTRHSLARIALRWMVRECFKTNTGLMFCTDKLRGIGLDPATLFPYVKERPPALSITDHKIQDPPAIPIPIQVHKYLTKKNHPAVHQKVAEHAIPFLGTEEEEELRDAVSPKYDQLWVKKWWWLLEILPMQLRFQQSNNEWVTRLRSNMGKPRYIPMQHTNELKVHRSVKLRIDAEYEDEKKRRRGKRYAPKPEWRVDPVYVD